jgi:hypothetical protein
LGGTSSLKRLNPKEGEMASIRVKRTPKVGAPTYAKSVPLDKCCVWVGLKVPFANIGSIAIGMSFL